MPILKTMKGLPTARLAAKGFMQHDWGALNECQRLCTDRVGITLQMEQESYLSHHPEVLAMLKLYIAHMATTGKRQDCSFKETGLWFTRPHDDIDQDVREYLGVGPGESYIKNLTKQDEKVLYTHSNDIQLVKDLEAIIKRFYPPTPWSVSPDKAPTPDTVSSSFISIVTSDTTQPTPEPVKTPEPTTSELFFSMISNTVDKAVYSHVNDELLRYDTAYVELMQCVEQAMEVPVLEIREDINEILYNSYKLFELMIMEKERVAAEIAWEKRMRKKLKRSIRRLENFKGYETPSTPRSTISSHESYLRPPQKPCVCNPQYEYNRYAKDRFGIYLPREEGFEAGNVTASPIISNTDVAGSIEEESKSVKSVISRRSTKSAKSARMDGAKLAPSVAQMSKDDTGADNLTGNAVVLSAE